MHPLEGDRLFVDGEENLRIAANGEGDLGNPKATTQIEDFQFGVGTEVDGFVGCVADGQMRQVWEKRQEAVVADNILPSAIVEYKFRGFLGFGVANHFVAVKIAWGEAFGKDIVVADDYKHSVRIFGCFVIHESVCRQK